MIYKGYDIVEVLAKHLHRSMDEIYHHGYDLRNTDHKNIAVINWFNRTFMVETFETMDATIYMRVEEIIN